MGRLPMEVNSGFFPGRRFDVSEIPRKFRGTRVRWTVHPDKSMTGVCEDCKEYAGQFMSIEEGTGLQPLHPNCVCSLKFEPAPGVGMAARSFSLQARNPELFLEGLKKKREAFAGGHECGHRH